MKPLTESQAAILTLMTGSLLCKPEILLKILEKKLGRKVGPQELANDIMIQEIQAKFMEEYKEMLDLVPDSLILTRQ